MVNGKTKVYGLVGNGIQNSLSPMIHNYINEKLDINAVYVPLDVELVNSNNIIQSIKTLNIYGANVTMPYKEVVTQHIKLKDDANQIKAVNTIVNKNGDLYGYNTDIYGIEKAFEYNSINVENKNVIVFGAGGSAKSVVYFLAKHKANISIINRTEQKAIDLANDVNKVYDCEIKVFLNLDYINLNEVNVVINTTSVGYNDENKTVVSNKEMAIMSELEFVYDLVYTPRETKLLRISKENNIKCDNGITMLVYQGVKSYEIWNNLKISQQMCENIIDRIKVNE